MNSTELKRHIFHPKSNKILLHAQVKAAGDFDKVEKLIKSISGHSLTKRLLYGNALPENLKSLRDSKIISNSGNLEGEISWLLFSIQDEAKKIAEFLEMKTEFEEAMVLEKLETAEEILNRIENEICHSLWGLENRFLLLDKKYGTEKNWEALSDFTKGTTDKLTLFFLENFSKRAESKVSYFRYYNILDAQMTEVKGPDEFREYLYFRLRYPSYEGIGSYSFFLTIESISSVLDRYLIIIEVLTGLLLNPTKGNQSLVEKVCQKLIEVIPNDNRLIQIQNILFPDESKRLANSEEILETLDEYTRGNFNDCIERVLKLLPKHPTSLELFEVYVKSLIELRSKFIPTGVSNFIDQVLENLFIILVRSEENRKATEKLLKISLEFISSSWGKQLFSLVSFHSNMNSIENFHILLYSLNSKFNNPRSIFLVSQLGLKTYSAVKNWFQSNFSYKATEVNIYVSEGDSIKILEDQQISENRKGLYLGRSLMVSNDYEGAIEHFERIKTVERLSVLTLEEINYHLFSCYLNLKCFRKATVLYVNEFIESPSRTTRLEEVMLLAVLEETVNKGVGDLIDLPIFYHMAYANAYSEYVAYDMFTENLGIQRPIQILESIDKFDKRKVIIFLREVCTMEILHYSLYFDGSDDIQSERIKILQELIKLDKAGEENYVREIAEISRGAKIREAIREVNKGRITVNVQQLKNKEASSLKEGFDRYQELAAYSEDKDWVAIDLSSRMIQDYLGSLNDENLRKRVVHMADPAFITFKAMFLEIRDKYLLSNEYGLDGYLSTRIRHGTLQNHIRSVFESLELISQKNKEGDYIENRYWNDRIPTELRSKKDEIQNAIKHFSKEVDNFTEFILTELIQVKTEKYQTDKQALFNYSLTSDQLAYLFQTTREKVKDHNAFLDFVFDFLEQHTVLILERIRTNFGSVIKNRFDSLISNFEQGIRDITLGVAFVDLTSSIMKCSTNIQNEVGNISEWFNLSNPSTDLTLDIETLIQTGVEITNGIYPNKQISPIINAEIDIPFTGTIHLIYLIRILLDNIIIHSGLSEEELKIKIRAELIDNKVLRLSFKNNVLKSVDFPALRSKLSKIKDDWIEAKGDYSKINIEGGSGFEKIRRILAIDMGCKNHDFDFSVEDNEVSVHIDLDVKILSI